MLQVQRFVNELMSSNCYILYDVLYDDCIVIDPGSEKCIQEQLFFHEKNLNPTYVILTHEHTDHTWGTNTLIDIYDSKVVCSKICAENLPKDTVPYFSYYYDDPNYHYCVKRVDIVLEDMKWIINWHDYTLRFFYTPGHSMGSVCFQIENMLFTGDTWMPYRPFVNKRNGSKELYSKSLQWIKEYAKGKNMTVYPGHGDSFINI